MNVYVLSSTATIPTPTAGYASTKISSEID